MSSAEFEHPPISEVVLGVQFTPPAGWSVAHLGLLWSQFRNDFPRTETHAPLEPAIEEFEPTALFAPVRIVVADQPPPPRLWMLNASGSELIQVQQDRFIHNWRKVDDTTPYPRYARLRDQFARELEQFQRFLCDQGLSVPTFDQCEITYVDVLAAGAGWERHGQLSEILTCWRPPAETGRLAEPESAQIALHYVIPDDTGQPLGRLHVFVAPATQPDTGQPVLTLTFTARGRPEGEGLPGVLRFLDRGHEWLVQGFVALTSEKMQRIWGRRDAATNT